MKTCPKCWENYPAEEKKCIRCGRNLVDGKPDSFRRFESRVDKQVRQNLRKLAVFVGVALLALVAIIAVILYLIIN